METVNTLVDQISKLTLIEASELVKALENKLGVKASAPVAAAPVAVGPAPSPPWRSPTSTSS